MGNPNDTVSPSRKSLRPTSGREKWIGLLSYLIESRRRGTCMAVANDQNWDGEEACVVGLERPMSDFVCAAKRVEKKAVLESAFNHIKTQ
ncbi:hypothetical protein L2E82_22591 [Cichorium intybus]|uniref:Uncharacterized protein n=1 Tax=Cichorium intybus TaxID=13427 RepID=A0ACB9DYU2_CICIN|nr:hypothetical protein L2E82_22591 [Cichorium intybus]